MSFTTRHYYPKYEVYAIEFFSGTISLMYAMVHTGSVHHHIPWPVPPSGCPREPQATVGAGHRKCRTGLLLVVTKVRVHLIFEALTYIVLRTLRTQSPTLFEVVLSARTLQKFILVFKVTQMMLNVYWFDTHLH